MVGIKANWSDLEPGFEDPLRSALTLDAESMPNEIAKALYKGNVAMAFQPVSRCDDPSRIAYYEGQLRLFDESDRVLPLRDYKAPVAGTLTARQLDCKALEIGLAALRDNSDIRLSINMSARSVGFREWIATLQSHFTASPHIGERLIFEVTERSAMLVPELTAAFMHDLQNEGVCFALDEFGSGAAELRHMRDFYFDIVKLCGAYVPNIYNDADNKVLVRALVMIAQQFEMVMVADQVSDPRESAWLAANGVDYIQGNLVGPATLYPPWAPRK
ncbi:EAL domain-containing protein [Pseudooceanicola algae]|uniref:Cyclic di-GMP phosphodiesterase PdeF n=1 Tax=Pseudooceanicola algae TaxID=1537215 RepID=A0A418SKK1_9RHOB|nr:EAL domain-containing protein [Pseudooceanicola algae]QPM90691.1 Cyclic di-GMP phosphodiesterase PdeF [Pseudooceanicola algae]